MRSRHAKFSPDSFAIAVPDPLHTQTRRAARGLLDSGPRSSRKRVAQAVSLALAASASSTLYAQQLEEVVVTATKRAESVLDVSVSMTAMTGAETRLLNLNDIKDLISFTPGITGNSKDSFLDTVAVRGIRTNLFGNGAEPSIGFFVNGLYQGRTGAAVSGLFDVERSEVLRGPQGFLFARGAVTGAFNVVTEKANTDGLEGYAEVDVGQRGVFVFEGAVNVPLTDNLAMRVSGLHTEEDGYVENLAGGPDLIAHDNDSLRVSFNYNTEKVQRRPHLPVRRPQPGRIHLPRHRRRPQLHQRPVAAAQRRHTLGCGQRPQRQHQ
jgi:iron complex outermembrane receptor protein